METVLAFDVYGTLIDTHGVVRRLGEYIGDSAAEFSSVWRSKQLEYSFRRGLMRTYETFDVCTRQALDYCCAHLGEDLTEDQKVVLLSEYRRLPAFDDVRGAISDLRGDGYVILAFSNGTLGAIEELLGAAQVRDLFDGVVSADDVRSFKPNPDVYDYLVSEAGVSPGQAWLISSNPFDVIGAVSVGLNSVWVRRAQASTFDPWGIEPTVTVSSLEHIRSRIAESRHRE